MSFPTPRFRGPLATHLVGLPLRGPGEALPVPPASDRGVWDARTGSADRVTLDDIFRAI